MIVLRRRSDVACRSGKFAYTRTLLRSRDHPQDSLGFHRFGVLAHHPRRIERTIQPAFEETFAAYHVIEGLSALVGRFGEVIDAAARSLGRANEVFELRTLFRIVVKSAARIRSRAFLGRHIRVTADEASVHTDTSRTLYPIRHVAFTRREE